MTDRATPVAGPAVLDPPRSQPLYLRHALAVQLRDIPALDVAR